MREGTRRFEVLACVGAIATATIVAACSAGSSSEGGRPGAGAGAAAGAGGGGGESGTGGKGGSGGGGPLIDAGVTDGNVDGPAVDPDAACATVAAKAGNPAVDIVWAVDTSGSMGDEIAKIKTNINSHFVPIISASPVDWQVIMVARRGTGNLQVCVDPPLGGPGCADNPPRFHQIECQVESNDALDLLYETYLGMPTIGLLPFQFCDFSKPWKNLARLAAKKVFVVVTDDEASHIFPEPTPISQQFDQALLADPQQMFGTTSQRNYVMNAIIGMDPNNPSDTCSGPNNSAVAPGVQYQALASLTGGQLASICEDDWSAIFQSLATGIVDSLACEYVVPSPGDGGVVDPDKVNVRFTPGSGAPEDLLRDDSAACDQGADGWQWDATKTKILLCGSTCQKVKADPMGAVDLLFGCSTQVKDPH